MNVPRSPATGSSFEAAELFQLRMALESTHEQRLQDLQDMLDFNAEAEARNPGLRWAVEQLGR
jgi:hypothetical protein